MQDFNILNFMLKCQGEILITVQGISMYPVLHENDKVVVVYRESYNIGDVVVFDYDEPSLVIHRVLMKTSNQYVCKGDNTFRLEQIEKNRVLGKVKYIVRNDSLLTLPILDNNFIGRSLDVYREYKKNDFNKRLTKQSKVYRDFARDYLNGN